MAQRGGKPPTTRLMPGHHFAAASAPCNEQEKLVPFSTGTGLPKPQSGSRCGIRCWRGSQSLICEGCQSSLAFSPIFFPEVKFCLVPAGVSLVGRWWWGTGWIVSLSNLAAGLCSEGSTSLPRAERVRKTWHTTVLQHLAPLEAPDSS